MSSPSNTTITSTPFETYDDTLVYLNGFGNSFESEFLAGALPKARNNPKRTFLYAEQLSGSAFTAPRAHNQRTWLYRLQPSTTTHKAVLVGKFARGGEGATEDVVDPMRWKPLPVLLDETTDFISGMTLMCGSADETVHYYVYHAYQSMPQPFVNATGDFLLVPHQGAMLIHTEVGRLRVGPTEVCVLPRGLVFQVFLQETKTNLASGYVMEITGQTSFQLPELGPIVSTVLKKLHVLIGFLCYVWLYMQGTQILTQYIFLFMFISILLTGLERTCQCS
jgi:homogentisate 1,2-dioxygenase